MVEKTIDWNPIRLEYITDQFATLGKLAKKYKVSESEIQHRSAGEKWRDQREKYAEDAQKKALKDLQKISVKTTVDMVKAGIFIVGQGLTAIQSKKLSPQDYKEALSALRAGKELIHAFLPKEVSGTIDSPDDTPEGIKRWVLNVKEKFGTDLIEKFGEEEDEDA